MRDATKLFARARKLINLTESGRNMVQVLGQNPAARGGNFLYGGCIVGGLPDWLSTSFASSLVLAQRGVTPV